VFFFEKVEEKNGQSRALNVLWWENPIGEGEYRREERAHANTFSSTLFRYSSKSVREWWHLRRFRKRGGMCDFDSRGRDDDKTSPSGLDPLCLDASVIRFLFLLLRGYPVIIGKLTDRLNFSSLLLHQ